jgi:N6-L-threonylcarbamoyladenine synthase
LKTGAVYILGIESSCDDTSAAVLMDDKILANLVASQKIHEQYGGVVPELASRAHQKNIVPVVDAALKKAGIKANQLSAIAYTNGPGLLGSLLVGTSFAKAYAMALDIPIIQINHMEAHILAHFIKKDIASRVPNFPLLCLTVSGGHTQIVLVKDNFSMEIIGETIDDAAGEAFDKSAKILGLSYPGGPLIDKYAQKGNPNKFIFPHPKTKNELDFSFSGLKTSILYFIKERIEKDNNFIEKNMEDVCASIQHTIVSILIEKLKLASKKTGITNICIAGGVAANSGLRKNLLLESEKNDWEIYTLPLEFCTDNGAMIAIAGYFKYLDKNFSLLNIPPKARLSMN